jgi:hypothetical protein
VKTAGPKNKNLKLPHATGLSQNDEYYSILPNKSTIITKKSRINEKYPPKAQKKAFKA